MEANTFSATVSQQPGLGIINLQGEINAFADQQLTEAFNQVLDSNPHTVVLNFSQVTYINSTGIALIVGLLARARQLKIVLSAFGLSDHYTQIFNITRLSDFINIYSDEAAALASQKAG